MQLSIIWKCAGILLVAAICACSAQDGYPKSSRNAPTRVPEKALDISVPLSKIGTKLGKVLTNGINLTAILDPIMGCITPTPPEKIKEAFATLPVDLQEDLEIRLQKYLLDFETFISKENITEYCNSEKFKEIHDFLWVEDIQFKDFLKFIQKFGYPTIYTSIRALYEYYECPAKLLEDIPTGPPAGSAKNTFQSQNKEAVNIRSQVLSSPATELTNNLLQLPAECNIMKVLTGFLTSGLLELLQLVETILDQIMTESSMQFLIGKISEPNKGVSFREFRLKTPVRELFVYLHEAIISDPFIDSVLDIVQGLTGLDLRAINLVETVLNILEFLVWGNASPVPPFEPELPQP